MDKQGEVSITPYCPWDDIISNKTLTTTAMTQAWTQLRHYQKEETTSFLPSFHTPLEHLFIYFAPFCPNRPPITQLGSLSSMVPRKSPSTRKFTCPFTRETSKIIHRKTKNFSPTPPLRNPFLRIVNYHTNVATSGCHHVYESNKK